MAESKALPPPLLNPLPQAGRAKRGGRSRANESLREFHITRSDCIIGCFSGARLLSQRVAPAWDTRISPGALQTLPAHLSSDGETGVHLHDCRWEARHADAVDAQDVGRVNVTAIRSPSLLTFRDRHPNVLRDHSSSATYCNNV